MKVFMIFLVLVGITFFSIDDAFGAVGWTSQEIYDFSDIIAVGKVTNVNSTFSPTMNLYHIQVEKFLKNPQNSTELLALGSKTESIRAGNEVFDAGDRALFFLVDNIVRMYPIYSGIYEVSTVSQSMDPNWDKCNIFEKNIPPDHWVFGGRNNHLQASQENKTDDFVTGKKITISYDIFNHEPVTKKVDFGMMVKNIDEPESLYEFTEIADRILEPCTVYETISWSFTPSEPANYLAEFYDLKGYTTSITIPVKSDTGFSGVAPLKQWGNDIPFDEIQCKQNLVLLQKYDDSPACVTESTKTKLVERGWTTKDSGIKCDNNDDFDLIRYSESDDIHPQRLVAFLKEGTTGFICLQYISNLDNDGFFGIDESLHQRDSSDEVSPNVVLNAIPNKVSREYGTDVTVAYEIHAKNNSTGTYWINLSQLCDSLPVVVWDEEPRVSGDDIPVATGIRHCPAKFLDVNIIGYSGLDLQYHSAKPT